MLVTWQLTAPIDFHLEKKKNTMEVNGVHQLVTILQNILCSAKQRNWENEG